MEEARPSRGGALSVFAWSSKNSVLFRCDDALVKR